MATTTNSKSRKSSPLARRHAASKAKANGSAEAAATEDDDSDSDDSDDAPAANESQEQQEKKLPRHLRMAAQMRRLAKRLEGIERKVSPWEQEEVTRDAKTAKVALEGLVESLEALGEDFKPKGTLTTTSTKIAVGVKVDIRDKHVERYADVLDEDDMKGLEVTRIAKGVVACTTQSGDRVIIPRGHIVTS